MHIPGRSGLLLGNALKGATLLRLAVMPAVLDGVLGTSWEHLGNLRPLVPVATLKDGEQVVLFVRPSSGLALRVDVVHKAITDLFGNATRQTGSDFRPTKPLGTIHDHALVFVFSKRRAVDIGREGVLPASLAL